MRERRSGHIINVVSTAAHCVDPTGVVYGATKFAVRAVSDGLRHETTDVRVRRQPRPHHDRAHPLRRSGRYRPRSLPRPSATPSQPDNINVMSTSTSTSTRSSSRAQRRSDVVPGGPSARAAGRRGTSRRPPLNHPSPAECFPPVALVPRVTAAPQSP
ncbi:SDR family NAD(P)-dependent oxidoreductase [Streptomyces sp. NBC_00322]|uniref:SDR family NAD(P)-dependent oxidoreductase n=1 Tax=Streptomyces sp. NBC_00322 TaxID=2975712 RepID=UPI003FA73712